MYSALILLVVCISSGLAAPGYIGGGYAPAVSHVSRYDVHSKPIVAAYEAPLAIAPVSIPLGHYGHYGYGHYPAAHSYSNRVDIHSPSYVRPLGHHGYGYGHALGIHDGSGYGYAVHGYGVQGLHHGY